ncbi:PP2C family protein-serine/threonine phosphatase [Streptomyces sp. NPDC000151]|uniref:PP2C family protein-serine/threonine phosphatase n=1 Tax=Streptomyces sp. NPDC000151 TaxID=3154244 RepID=UPI003324B99C
MALRGRWGVPGLWAVALVVSLLLAVLNVVTGGRTPGVTALVIGPLLVCPRHDAHHTAALAAWALLLALAAGTAHGLVTTPRFALDYLLLLATSALTVRTAAAHTARGAELKQVTEVARAAQSAIMHPVSARVGDIEVCTRQHCAVERASVAGDVYDAVHTPYGPRVLIADVSGHDLACLRTTAQVIGAFRELAQLTPELPDLARKLDARLAPELGPEEFVTALFAEFAPGEVRLVNCGHPAPLRAGERIRLLESPTGPATPLGLQPAPRLQRFRLDPGDRLLFYTDGLSEARDPAGADFPLLEHGPAALAAPSSFEALDALYGAVVAHVGAPLTDDLTLVLCRPTELRAPAPAPITEGRHPNPGGGPHWSI